MVLNYFGKCTHLFLVSSVQCFLRLHQQIDACVLTLCFWYCFYFFLSQSRSDILYDTRQLTWMHANCFKRGEYSLGRRLYFRGTLILLCSCWKALKHQGGLTNRCPEAEMSLSDGSGYSSYNCSLFFFFFTYFFFFTDRPSCYKWSTTGCA